MQAKSVKVWLLIAALAGSVWTGCEVPDECNTEGSEYVLCDGESGQSSGVYGDTEFLIAPIGTGSFGYQCSTQFIGPWVGDNDCYDPATAIDQWYKKYWVVIFSLTISEKVTGDADVNLQVFLYFAADDVGAPQTGNTYSLASDQSGQNSVQAILKSGLEQVSYKVTSGEVEAIEASKEGYAFEIRNLVLERSATDDTPANQNIPYIITISSTSGSCKTRLIPYTQC